MKALRDFARGFAASWLAVWRDVQANDFYSLGEISGVLSVLVFALVAMFGACYALWLLVGG